jgi:hypothetical protein
MLKDKIRRKKNYSKGSKIKTIVIKRMRMKIKIKNKLNGN